MTEPLELRPAQRWNTARRALLAALLAAVALVAVLARAHAQPRSPPQTPILRVDSTMHTARVRKLVYDAPRDRLLTAGDDKTARLWQLPKGRLLRVFRVPIAEGFEGRVYVADMHPNGRVVAAGGWTGWDFDRAGAIYLFDVETGEIARRLSGFAETIGTLAFSPDGRHLAVGLQGAKGLRVLRTNDYAEVARDTEFGDRILDLSFASDGRLAVAALDGYVRLYDAQFRLIGRRKTTTGRQPLSIKFSPDGRWLATAFSDLAPPAVYQASDLALAFSADASALPGQRRLVNLQWSNDGESLYATGEEASGTQGRIIRWRQAGRGPAEVIAVPAYRPGNLWPLSGGRMAFGSEDPHIGVLHPNGKTEFIALSDVADLRVQAGALRVSPDAMVVDFPVRHAADARVRLDILERSVTRESLAAPDTAPALPVPEAFRLSGDDDAIRGPKMAGRPLPLDDYEVIRASAVTPDGATLVLGTEWSVRAVDAQARLRWRYRAPGVVWQVKLGDGGRTVVAAVSDGTLRWLRADDGVEYLAAYVHPRTLEWIAWTPQGYYVSSQQGDQLIGWHLNRTSDQAPLFYRAVQFERLLYRPDVVDAALTRRDPLPVLPAPRREKAFEASELRRIAPPTIRLSLQAGAGEVRDGAARARLRVGAVTPGLPMRDLTVYVNNLPITPARQRLLSGAEARSVEREIEIDLSEPENLVRVEVSNGEALGLQELMVEARPGGAHRAEPEGDLYLLAVGANQFPRLRPNNQSADLDFAARDATEVARFFQSTGPRQFRKVHVRVLSDESAEPPTRERIVRALEMFSRAGPRDTVMLFLASHAISDPRGNYYFVPADATTGDWNGASGGLDDVPSLLHWSVFFDALRQAAGRRVLVVDTCHARGIEGRLDVHSLVKRSASSAFALVVAAKANEESQEYRAGRHGLFTYAWLEALRDGASDVDGNGHVTLQEAFAQTLPIVERHRHPQVPQTPQLQAPWPLDRTALVRNAPPR